MKKRGPFVASNNSRTKNSLYNFISGIGGQLLSILLQFAVRTVFIQTLGKSYLGINGLFSNILTMLSLAELGVGSAILFKLYEPIVKDDHKRIAILMSFYKTVYRYIGLVIAVLGVLIIPFLPYLAKDFDKLTTLNINAVLIFLLYLGRSVSSYFFFAYKSGIIKANQKEYIINIINYFGSILSSVIQIILLKTICDFTAYVIVLIVTVIAENIVIGYLADRMYPYINDKYNEKLSKAEVKGVFKDCGALLIYRLNKVVLKATDNLILSSFIGLDIVGLYSNYYIFYTTIDNIFTRTFGSITHSLGNLHVKSSKEHEYEVFKVVNLLTAVIGGTAGVGIMTVSNELVSAWIGSDWIIPQPFAILMGIEIYTLAVRQEFTRYRSSMGLFQQGKYRPLAGMIINIIVSIALVRSWGICGVLVGTIVADWTTLAWYDPIITHKYGFKNNALIKGYFIRFLKYTITIILVGIIDYIICNHILVGFGLFSIIIHALICALTVPIALVIIGHKTYEGKYVLSLIRKFITSVLRRFK